MDYIERHNKRLEDIDAKIAKLQEEKMESLDLMLKDQEGYFAQLEKERKDKDEKDSAVAKDILDKTPKVEEIIEVEQVKKGSKK